MSHSSSERKKRENNTFTVVTTTVHNNKVALASVKIYLYVYFKRFTSLLCQLIYYRAYTGGSPTGHNHRTTCVANSGRFELRTPKHKRDKNFIKIITPPMHQ